MTPWNRSISAAVSLLTVLMIAGCGKFFVDENQPPDSTTCSTNCLFIGNYNTTATSADVADFAAVNPLTVVMSENVALGNDPVSMAVSPNNEFLYVASATGNIYDFAINTSLGSLGAVASAGEITNAVLSSIAISPSGNYLAAAGTASNSSCSTGEAVYLEFYPISSSGVLGTEAGTPIEGSCVDAGTALQANAIAFAPNGGSFYVALGSYGLQSYSYAEGTSSITVAAVQNEAAPAETLFNNVVVDAKSQYLLVSASGTSGGIYQATIGTNATLGNISSVIVTGSAGDPIAIDGTNKYVYVADKATGGVYGYTFGSSGLTALTGSPFQPSSAMTGVAGMVADSGGKFVITIGETGPNLQEYTIGTSGGLTPASTGTTGSVSGYYPATIAITQ